MLGDFKGLKRQRLYSKLDAIQEVGLIFLRLDILIKLNQWGTFGLFFFFCGLNNVNVLAVFRHDFRVIHFCLIHHAHRDLA